ncbi:hypothetical protein DXV76_03890 [Rhodobacteraceae bacterium CCMM004]|nr:hypothetical protein DXV76_03890 [Rhodobacteraceae bacterium CCMM004]
MTDAGAIPYLRTAYWIAMAVHAAAFLWLMFVATLNAVFVATTANSMASNGFAAFLAFVQWVFPALLPGMALLSHAIRWRQGQSPTPAHRIVVVVTGAMLAGLTLFAVATV